MAKLLFVSVEGRDFPAKPILLFRFVWLRRTFAMQAGLHIFCRARARDHVSSAAKAQGGGAQVQFNSIPLLPNFLMAKAIERGSKAKKKKKKKKINKRLEL